MFNRLKQRFRLRAVNQFAENKTESVIPDPKTLSSVVVVLDNTNKNQLKSFETKLKSYFGAATISFVIISSAPLKDVLESDKYCEVLTKDFDISGLLKEEKKDYLTKLPKTNMLLNLAVGIHGISDYISTLVNSDFRISFVKSKEMIYDLVISNYEKANKLEMLEMMHDYLLALTGNKQES